MYLHRHIATLTGTVGDRLRHGGRHIDYGSFLEPFSGELADDEQTTPANGH